MSRLKEAKFQCWIVSMVRFENLFLKNIFAKKVILPERERERFKSDKYNDHYLIVKVKF